MSFRGRLLALFSPSVCGPVRQSTLVTKSKCLPSAPRNAGRTGRRLLARGWALCGGPLLPEGRGPLEAAELARKAHDECVSKDGHADLIPGPRGFIQPRFSYLQATSDQKRP